MQGICRCLSVVITIRKERGSLLLHLNHGIDLTLDAGQPLVVRSIHGEAILSITKRALPYMSGLCKTKHRMLKITSWHLSILDFVCSLQSFI